MEFGLPDSNRVVTELKKYGFESSVFAHMVARQRHLLKLSLPSSERLR